MGKLGKKCPPIQNIFTWRLVSSTGFLQGKGEMFFQCAVPAGTEARRGSPSLQCARPGKLAHLGHEENQLMGGFLQVLVHLKAVIMNESE